MSQIDISCCSVVYKRKVWESTSGAVSDCLNKRFRIFKNNLMHHENNIHQRLNKLEEKGWEEYNISSKNFNPLTWKKEDHVADHVEEEEDHVEDYERWQG